MSSKNIFEVLQNIAENTESNEKFLNILKENGFTGTLEEAENQINQQTQVVLNNLTTEDLQNIAGGKSLMNDKLKKAIAVGGASLMAAGTVMPSSLAANKNDTKKFANKAVTYVKDNAVHTGVTGALTLTTAALLVKSIFGGKTIPGLPFTDAEKAFLWQMDLSNKKQVLEFVEQLSAAKCELEVNDDEQGGRTIKFTATKDNVLKDTLADQSNNPILFTTETLLKTLLKAMDDDTTYVTEDDTMTDAGATVLNYLAGYIVTQINNGIEAQKERETLKGTEGEAVETAKEAADEARTKAAEKATAAMQAAQSQELDSQDKTVKERAEQARTKAANEADEARTNYEKATAEVGKAEEALKQAIKKARDEAKKLEMPKLEFKAGDSVKLEKAAE